MVQFPLFEVEQWMDKYETAAKCNIAETCCDSISFQDLHSFSNPTCTSESISTTNFLPLSFSTKLTYGSIRGTIALRQNICRLYDSPESSLSQVTPADVLVTNGAIAANFLLFYSLIGPGDHVICVYPTYQALYAVAQSLGAEVDLWKFDVVKGENPSLEDLKKMIRKPDADGEGGTKLIVINNPNNPTGVVMPEEYLLELASIAHESGNIPILSDEVYRPIFRPDIVAPPSIISIYEYGISTGSMSKAFSLAGIRVGWIVARDPNVIQTCAQARDYTTISISQLDDAVACAALHPPIASAIIARNTELAANNLKLLDKYVNHRLVGARYVQPQGATTAFVQFWNPVAGEPVDDLEFCRELMEKEGVLVAPGSLCFGQGKDFKGFVRIGYCCSTEQLQAGLEAIEQFVKQKRQL
ncbi:pyridoxal phosphate-dependent transferase [Kalaharituber pfeilii]|nr:pyridoxal phosphate-dependent transferase [Kalaharituber pfeilii]